MDSSNVWSGYVWEYRLFTRMVEQVKKLSSYPEQRETEWNTSDLEDSIFEIIEWYLKQLKYNLHKQTFVMLFISYYLFLYRFLHSIKAILKELDLETYSRCCCFLLSKSFMEYTFPI